MRIGLRWTMHQWSIYTHTFYSGINAGFRSATVPQNILPSAHLLNPEMVFGNVQSQHPSFDFFITSIIEMHYISTVIGGGGGGGGNNFFLF